ncbi:MAG TPA: LysM peptidoglycan-binding domain-containing protein [Gaiellaceae bacterium]|nr:LysM peptidoglycan-binding domain-containing protein [Gaiellaceae bacterium]
MFGKTLITRIALIVGAALLVWSYTAHASQAHGARQVITVRPYQTLWTIAAAHYAGDTRNAVWEIERANHLSGADVSVGETLVLP